MNDRRDFLKKGAIIALGGLATKLIGEERLQQVNDLIQENEIGGETPFKLPDLPYSYNALEPFIDAKTMEIHHTKHHQAYVNNLNKALEGKTAIPDLEDICKTISKYDVAVRNNGGGHYNHSLFWKMMRPNKEGKPNMALGEVAEAIQKNFGSFDDMKKKFAEAASKRFGSGWAWLIEKPDGKLEICSTANQDNPLMDISESKGRPLLALDVWEHAYYLKYQNKRVDYIDAWFNIVNWEFVNDNYKRK